MVEGFKSDCQRQPGILKNFEKWGSVDSHHIFAVRYPYPTDNHGNIIFSIVLNGFECDHPVNYLYFDPEYIQIRQARFMSGSAIFIFI